jgi:hypothetical protein
MRALLVSLFLLSVSGCASWNDVSPMDSGAATRAILWREPEATRVETSMAGSAGSTRIEGVNHGRW